jgi:hypothetical protein
VSCWNQERLPLAAFAVLAASGCVVVTRPVTQQVVVGVEESAPTESAGVVLWDITTQIEPDMANVTVTATRVPTCTRQRFEVYDELGSLTTEVEWKGGDGGLGGGAQGGLLGAAMWSFSMYCASVLFLPVTAATWFVAKDEVSHHHDTRTRKTRPLETTRAMCPHVAANVPVELTLPSGAVLQGATGPDGRASFVIPAAEPDDGTAITRVADQTRSTAFYRTTSGCARARDRLFARVRVAAAVEERARLLRALPAACGDPRARAWSLTATAALDAVAGRCDSILGLAGQVRAIDRALYDRAFASEPDIAGCLDGTTVARQRREACLQRRRAAMLGAQRIDDVAERARVLASVPACDAPL